MDNKQALINYCKSIGIDVVGFCECRRFDELELFFSERKLKGLQNEFEEDDVEKRINPFIYMQEGKTIVSIAFPYLFNQNTNKGIYFSKYTLGRDYHVVVKQYLDSICSFIEKQFNGNAISFVDSNSLPERYIAYLSGIGFRGKNNMIINEKYGSYFFLGEIITDIYFEWDLPKECMCMDCDICIKACPSGALSKEQSNPNICLSYITQKKEIEDKYISKLGGRLFGCDTCQDVCPYNKKIEYSTINEFKPQDFMKEVNLEELIYINNEIFKEKYKNTSCGWRGKNILQRNAIINALSKGYIKSVDEKHVNSPYVKKYLIRLLELLKL